MSFERIGEIEFFCDNCGEQVNTGTNDLPEALSEIKSMGWRVIKAPDSPNDSGWDHFCSCCNPAKTRNVFEKVKT